MLQTNIHNTSNNTKKQKKNTI